MKKGMINMTTKPRKTLRLSALLLIVCLISTVMLSGTFAKYTSEYAGQDTALVARWSFTSTGGDGDIALGTSAAPAELKLFDHLYYTHMNQTDGGANYIIAPGVGDEFTLKMDYIADVDADVLLTFDTLAASAAVPIEYSVDGGTNWVTLANLAEALANRIISNGGVSATESSPLVSGQFLIPAVATGGIDHRNINQTIKWRWPYNVSDALDTADTTLGNASQTAAASIIGSRTTYGIKVTLNATQVVPLTTPVLGSITAIAAISGTPQVGVPLTAGALTPAVATASYQWQISTSAGGTYTNITGATSNTYSPVAADQTKFIKVVATGISGYSGTVTSAATAVVAAP